MCPLGPVSPIGPVGPVGDSAVDTAVILPLLSTVILGTVPLMAPYSPAPVGPIVSSKDIVTVSVEISVSIPVAPSMFRVPVNKSIAPVGPVSAETDSSLGILEKINSPELFETSI